MRDRTRPGEQRKRLVKDRSVPIVFRCEQVMSGEKLTNMDLRSRMQQDDAESGAHVQTPSIGLCIKSISPLSGVSLGAFPL